MKLQEAVSRIIAAMDEAWIPTPEDVIIQKLIWHRSKDLEDVLGVIAVNAHQLDPNYLRQWAGRLNLSQSLDNVLGVGH